MNYLSQKVKMICSLEQGDHLIPLWPLWCLQRQHCSTVLCVLLRHFVPLHGCRLITDDTSGAISESLLVGPFRSVGNLLLFESAAATGGVPYDLRDGVCMQKDDEHPARQAATTRTRPWRRHPS